MLITSSSPSVRICYIESCGIATNAHLNRAEEGTDGNGVPMCQLGTPSAVQRFIDGPLFDATIQCGKVNMDERTMSISRKTLNASKRHY
jgi:hypothetical protein